MCSFTHENLVDKIDGDKLVKVTDMGQILEIMSMDKLTLEPPPITKVNQDLYMLNSTGEVLEYQHTVNRAQDIKSLRKTFKKIRNIINYNFKGGDNELAFTLTYGENMRDRNRLYCDFKRFFMRLRYEYSKDVDYLNVVEPQARGAWHCHVLLRFNALDKIYIPNEKIASLWGQGFVSVKAISRDVDNLGAYLSAYLGDIELTSENERLIQEFDDFGRCEIKSVEVDGVEKKFIKGGRLYLYPTGMNIYRKSRGIKIPDSSYMPYSEVKKIVGFATPNYSSMFCIVNDDLTAEINRIIFEQYNLQREKSQDVK